jgi:CRP-like cAMP-binding protein
MAILDGEPRSATVETMREARLLEIAREDFNQLLLARPMVRWRMVCSPLAGCRFVLHGKE